MLIVFLSKQFTRVIIVSMVLIICNTEKKDGDDPSVVVDLFARVNLSGTFKVKLIVIIGQLKKKKMLTNFDGLVCIKIL